MPKLRKLTPNLWFDDQAEGEHFWDALAQGGDPDPAVAERVMTAFLPMKKLVIADLVKAARG